MCSLVMSLCSRDVITIHWNGSRLTGLTCSKAPGFWMVEHQIVNFLIIPVCLLNIHINVSAVAQILQALM